MTKGYKGPWLMTKDGKDGKGNPYKKVIAKNEAQKGAFEKYGFKAKEISQEEVKKMSAPQSK